MQACTWPRIALAAFMAALPGCTAIRELPRDQYAARPERKNVRVETVEGLRYEFDQVKVSADTLVGYRMRDTDSHFEEYDTLPVPLERIARLSTRHVDWYRTGLIGGTALAAVLAAALTATGSSGGSSGSDPCPRCPD